MDEKTCQALMAHVRRAIAALRLLDLRDLERCVQLHGSAADHELVTALLLALETLPKDGH